MTLAALSLQGCGTTILASRNTNPVIQDFSVRWWSDATTLSTTASRRLALMAYKPDGQGRESLQICAEPPPDVGETFAKAIAAQLDASVPQPAGTISAGVSVASTVATSIAPLMVRTQGLQVLRDSAYTLCIDKLNGWIPSETEYMRIKTERFDKAIELIKMELPLLPARGGTVPAPTLPPTGAASAPSPSAAAAASAVNG
ncbi:MAG: hypothetical protein ACJ8GJ_04105 [Vitreoscilla sp.]